MNVTDKNTINNARLKNNSNTVNILRLATQYFPVETKQLLTLVNKGDAEISKLLTKLETEDSDPTSILDELEELRARNNKPWMMLYELAEMGDAVKYNMLRDIADDLSNTIMNIPNKQHVLILAAHPDDETLGCGGTINKLHMAGCTTQLLTFTDGVGSRNNNESNRNPKLERVSEILGIDTYTSADFPDNAMDSVPQLDLCKYIEKNIQTVPDIILTHFVGDLNVDHQLVTKATLTVFRPQAGDRVKIYSYHVPSSTDYNPLHQFDAQSYFRLSEDNINNKLKALAVYDEEMREYPHSRSYDNVKNLSKVWGCEVGVEYAEKFKLVRHIL